MSLRPTISVIIVSWNAKNYLHECLESLFATACAFPLEVFVVDNASSDGSPEFVAENYPQVNLIRNESNLGFSKANNIGIRSSTGTYICLVNSDVKFLEGCIGKLAEFMQAQPKAGIAGPRMLNSAGVVGRSCRGFPTLWNMLCNAIGLDLLFPHVRLFGGYVLRFWPQDSNRSVDILGGWFWIVRRSALSDVGLLDESFFFYAEDMDWCKRFKMKNWSVEFLADAASIHYGGGSSARAPLKYYIQQQRADFQYWKKHHSKPARAVYFMICLLHQSSRAIAHCVLSLFSENKESHALVASRNWQCFLWCLKGAR